MTYQINTEKILFTQLGDEGVVYDIEKNEYVTLNETFYKIMRGINEGKNNQEIVSLLCSEYAISETDCLKEVEKAVDQLKSKEYIN